MRAGRVHQGQGARQGRVRAGPEVVGYGLPACPSSYSRRRRLARAIPPRPRRTLASQYTVGVTVGLIYDTDAAPDLRGDYIRERYSDPPALVAFPASHCALLCAGLSPLCLCLAPLLLSALPQPPLSSIPNAVLPLSSLPGHEPLDLARKNVSSLGRALLQNVFQRSVLLRCTFSASAPEQAL
jgi:hypothetical protein